MKNFLLLLSLSLLCGMVTAQTAPKWQWLVGGGSNYRGKNANTSDKHDHLVSMAIDDSANVYLAGILVEDTKWAGVNYTFPQYTGTYSIPTVFFSKYSACGAHLWTKYFSNPSATHSVMDMKLTKQGNLIAIIGGQTSQYPSIYGNSPSSIDTSFNDSIYGSINLRRYFTVRGSDGKLLSTKNIPDESGIAKNGLPCILFSVPENNKLWTYAGAGVFDVIFGGINYKGNLLMMQLTENLTPLTHFKFSAVPPISLGEKAILPASFKTQNGHIYACGTWGDSVNFISENTNMQKFYQPNPTYNVVSGFYFHYDSTGKLLSLRVGKGEYSQFQSMDVDAEGNVYLLTHGPDTIPYFDNIQAVTARRDTFNDHLMIIKLDKNDNVVARNVVRIWTGAANSGTVPNKGVRIPGVIKVDPKSQEVYVFTQIPRQAIKVDSVNIWETAIQTVGSTEGVILKYDKNLKYQWNQRIENDLTIGSASTGRLCIPEHIQVDKRGNVLVGGTFTFALRINDTLKVQKPSNCNQWIYFARYGYPCGSNFSLIKPMEPQALDAQAQSQSAIQLDWAMGNGNEWGYRIYRSPNPNGPFALIDSTNAGTTQYLNTGLQAATTYYYRITAFNNTGSSDSSNIASATTLNPVGIASIATEYIMVYPNPAVGAVTLSISENAIGAMFTLYDMAGSTIKTTNLKHTTTTIGLHGVAAGLYQYRITDEKGVLKRGGLVVE